MNIKCLFAGHDYKAIFAVDSADITAVQQVPAGSTIPCFIVLLCRRCGKAVVDGRVFPGGAA